MVFLKLDTNFLADDRVIEVSPLARLEYVACCLIAKRLESDGTVTLAQVRREQPDITDHEALLAELVNEGLLAVEDDDKHYRITSWLKHNKAVEEINEIRAARAEAGRRGGQTAGRGRPKIDRQSAYRSIGKVPKKNSPETETETETETPTSSGDAAAAFEDFYAAYPRQGAKPKAKAAYMRARKTATHADLVTGLTRWKSHYAAEQTEARYIPLAARWLSEERWRDAPPTRAQRSVIYI